MIDTYRDTCPVPIVECQITENTQWVRGTSHYLKVHHKGKYYSIFRSWSPDFNNCLHVSEIIDGDHAYTGWLGHFFHMFMIVKFRKQIKQYGI